MTLSTFAPRWHLMLLAAASLAACDDAQVGDLADASAPDASNAPKRDGGMDGDDAGEVDATLTEVGLDQRPDNPTCVAPPRPPDTAASVRVVPAFRNLTFDTPVALLQAPGDASKWYVVEKPGRVKVFENDPLVTVSTDFIDIVDRVNSVPNEAGLLGMAFHPDFANNGQFFLSYTANTGPRNLRSTVARFTVAGAAGDPATFSPIFPPNDATPNPYDQPFDNHNGGNIAFGPDGYLYFGLGDGGSGGDPLNSGQTLTTPLGKMLRVDVDNVPMGARYGIPSTNPFAQGGAGLPELFAWGLRNPWRFSFDRATGALWAGDVGQNEWEEVDLIENGGNYGWKQREGAHCFVRGCTTAGFIDPVVEYPHPNGGSRSIVGGYVYRGSAIPSLVGRYVYADTITGEVFAIAYDAEGIARHTRIATVANASPVSFGEGPDGELYLVDISGGLFKIEPAGTPMPDTFPKRLSQTGCVDPNDARKMAPGLIPYDVNAPLWSDGAAKERWLALPNGAQITIDAEGDWAFPNGTVLVKSFFIGGRPVETRLFMRHPDGIWAGYSYEWNDEGTDAELLAGSRVKTFEGQAWSFPSRSDCLTCHTEVAGRSLGLETGQLNRVMTYASTGRAANQLATLDHIGLFSSPLAEPSTLTAFPSTDDAAAPVEARARAYLHSNCSFCHQPDGTGRGPADFRFATPLAMTNVCDRMPEAGDLGVAGARLLAPGQPELSIMSLRMHALDARRMPPLSTSIVDAEGTALIDAWIQGFASCP